MGLLDLSGLRTVCPIGSAFKVLHAKTRNCNLRISYSIYLSYQLEKFAIYYKTICTYNLQWTCIQIWVFEDIKCSQTHPTWFLHCTAGQDVRLHKPCREGKDWKYSCEGQGSSPRTAGCASRFPFGANSSIFWFTEIDMMCLGRPNCSPQGYLKNWISKTLNMKLLNPCVCSFWRHAAPLMMVLETSKSQKLIQTYSKS